MTEEEQLHELTKATEQVLDKLGYTLNQLPPQDGVFVVSATPRCEYGTREDGSFFKMATFGAAYTKTSLKASCLLGVVLAVVDTGGDLSA